MDNYFTSPTLFECLATHDIFALGTCRLDRTAGAVQFWDSLDRNVHERGQMIFARSGEIAIVQWENSKDLILCSSIYIAHPSVDAAQYEGEDHFKPLLYK